MAGVGAGLGYSRSRSKQKTTTKIIPTAWAQRAIEGTEADYARLRGPSPYAGSDLGYDPATLAMIPGGERDLAAGALQGAEQGINDVFAAPGGPGTMSFAHKAALSGLRGDYAARVAESGRIAALTDAAVRREDMARRIGAGQSLIDLGRQYSEVRQKTKGRTYTGSGSVSAGAGTGGGTAV